MKLTKSQIQDIERLLAKDKLFYYDIRHEMTDHIAITIEEQLQENSDFKSILNGYMNSHLKVRLLTAAREQELLRDKQNRDYILKQFVMLRGILFLVLTTAVLFVAKFDIWAYNFFELLFLALLSFIAFGQKRVNKKQPFLARMTLISQLYFAFPYLLIMLLHRFTNETELVMNCKIVAMSIMFTGYYLTYRSANHLQKQKYV